MEHELLMPHDVEAEQWVLGSALIEPDVAARLPELVRVDDFYREEHRWIAQAIIDIYRSGSMVSSYIVSDELKQRKQIIRDPMYLFDISNIPTAIYAEHYAQSVSKMASLRRWIGVATKIHRMAFDSVDPMEIFAYIEEAKRELQPGRKEESIMMWDDSFNEYSAELERRKEQLARGGSPFTFPWHSWNRMCDPAEPGLPILISGDTGMGKTMYFECMADWWAKNGLSVVFAHAELNKAVMLDRRMCRHSGISRSELKSGNLTNEQEDRIAEVDSRLSSWSGKIHYVHCPSWSVEDLTLRAGQMRDSGDCDVLIYDYMKKAGSSDRQERLRMGEHQKAADDYGLFHDFLEEKSIVGVTGDQLNKEGKAVQSGYELKVHHIEGSGHKANFVNVVGLGYREVLDAPFVDANGNRFEEGSKGPMVQFKFDKNTLGSLGVVNQVMNPSRFHVADAVKRDLNEFENEPVRERW